jgi:hypothetical protein
VSPDADRWMSMSVSLTTGAPSAPASGVTWWRVHLVWALLVLVPFIGSFTVMAASTPDSSDRIETILVLYGPAMTALWLVGHTFIGHLHRAGRRRPVPLV